MYIVYTLCVCVLVYMLWEGAAQNVNTHTSSQTKNEKEVGFLLKAIYNKWP